MLELLRLIAKKHYLFRPDVLLILKHALGVNPHQVKEDANGRIKMCVIQSIADLIWNAHPANGVGAHDGVDLDALQLMADIATGEPDAPVQQGVSLYTPEQVLLTFTNELFHTIRAPYSPAFARALGSFLTAGGRHGVMVRVVLKLKRMGESTRDAKEGIKNFADGGYRRFMRKEDHPVMQEML
jgi:hypothetical protein